MRSRRILGSSEACVYHCISRTVNGERLLRRREQEVFRKMLHQVADFSGVELMTYVIMDNHFHVLVRVSKKAQDIDDTEFLRRFRVLYPKPTQHRAEDPNALAVNFKNGDADAQKLRAQLVARMGNVSHFMRTLKQRFTLWFNKTHERFGPLWNDRFKSCIIENDPVVVKTVAAYIDLNPVRAGIVKDPKDYRFCGYAEAVAGNKRLRAGICAILGHPEIQQSLADYRRVLFGKGAMPKANGSGVLLSEKAARAVMEQQGALSQGHQLLQRLRYFSEGAVIGSHTFVQACIQEWSSKIGDQRTRKPQPLDAAGPMAPLSCFKRLRTRA